MPRAAVSPARVNRARARPAASHTARAAWVQRLDVLARRLARELAEVQGDTLTVLLYRERPGLTPSWGADPSIGNHLVNARSETAAEKPAFRATFRRQRCLLPADGFFEWRAEGWQRQPYLFRLREMAARSPSPGCGSNGQARTGPKKWSARTLFQGTPCSSPRSGSPLPGSGVAGAGAASSSFLITVRAASISSGVP
jgi:SOS response associated peptidase (SRAP)